MLMTSSILHLVSSLHSTLLVLLSGVIPQALKQSSSSLLAEQMCLEKASMAAGTGEDTSKLTVCVQLSFVMLGCVLLRMAILSKRYCICVLLKYFI